MTTQVVVDARALGDASAFRGIGRYARGLLDRLGQRGDLEVTALAARDVPLPPGIRRREVIRIAPSRFATREHELLLPLDLERAGGEVVHSPAQDPPRWCRRPWVQTLHGLAPLAQRSPEYAAERKLWARWAPRVRRAGAVIAVSEFCARQGVELLGLDPARVHVVHHGVDRRFRSSGAAPEPDVPFVAFVGEFGPSKGHRDAFALIAAIAERGLPHRLKVAGRVAPWYRKRIEAEVARSPRPDLIDLLGYVGGQLPDLLRQASALVVTSRYESFCLPALEAMAAGTPVVAYSNTALPEIVGDAGRLVDDGDLRELSEATAAVLRDRSLAEELRLRGRQRSAGFSWERCAAGHAEVFTALVR